MFNLEQLRMFVEAVETGSFSASARKLGKVQSAVSQGISNLEIDLDVDLFDRSTRKPTLTAEGTRLLSYARSVLQQAEEMNAVARGLGQGEEIQLKLALEDAILVPRLGQILDDFGRKFRATAIEVISAASPDIPGMIKSARADIGLMFTEATLDPAVEQSFIGNLPFHAVCQPDHPLAGHEEIFLKDLIPHRQLMLRGEAGTSLDHFPPLSAEVWWATSFHAVRELVMQGVGWSYLPGHFVEQAISTGRLHRMNLSIDHKPWSPPVERVTGKHRRMGPAMSWLSEALKELLA